MNKENEIQLLSNVQEILSKNPDANQRNIAESVDMSLGMTNAMLKRFVEKGWICMNRLSTRTIKYALTPAGISEIAHRSYRFIKQTMQSVYKYKDVITKLIYKSKKTGYTDILVAGYTDIQFLIDYAAQTICIPVKQINEKEFFLQLSNISSNTLVLFNDNEFYLSACDAFFGFYKKKPSNYINIMELLAV